jgi:hypothetical protein
MNRPRLIKQGCAEVLEVQNAPYLILGGELHNSSASSLSCFEQALDRACALNINTILAPLYWELIEPSEGHFDLSLLDGMLTAVRGRGLKWVPLWFGAMKNATACYAPGWVREDTRRFPRAETAPGRPTNSLSCVVPEAARCDALALAAVMQRIRQLDAHEQTVIMVQVENEPGLLGAARDVSPSAEAAFQGAVPSALMEGLAAREDTLVPELKACWQDNGALDEGCWTEVFGTMADEVFMAWHVARHTGIVAAAGRAAYPLPLFANAWLVHGPGYQPGQYPSGGPIAKMLDIWRIGAPEIDFLAPDIYDADFRAKCAEYAQPGNPLFIPEARNTPVAAAQAVYAIGAHQAIGFSPFGIEDLTADHPLADAYRALADLAPRLATARPKNALTAFLQQADHEVCTGTIGPWSIEARAEGTLDAQAPGCALVVETGEKEFLVFGRRLVLRFSRIDLPGSPLEWRWVEAGHCRDGGWTPERRLNGDETYHGTAIRLGPNWETVRARLLEIEYRKK